MENKETTLRTDPPLTPEALLRHVAEITELRESQVRDLLVHLTETLVRHLQQGDSFILPRAAPAESGSV